MSTASFIRLTTPSTAATAGKEPAAPNATPAPITALRPVSAASKHGLSCNRPLKKPRARLARNPCHPGFVMPCPGSVVTVVPSADTVAVPSITISPLAWSKE